MTKGKTFAVFDGPELVVRGTIDAVIGAVLDRSGSPPDALRIFNEETGRAVDFNWQGGAEEVLERAKAQLDEPARGRPKLGVEAREVTLLPRHWRWLESQRGSASAVLRRLVETAMRSAGDGKPNVDPVYWQMSALAGDCREFEEAARALFAFDFDTVRTISADWPGDLGPYLSTRLDDITADKSSG